MSPLLRQWWTAYCDELGFTPTIVQGSWNKGISKSAGTHDKGGCLDLRSWNLTDAQIDKVIKVGRSMGAAVWLRDKAHGGFDPHVHLLLGVDTPLSYSASRQWKKYLKGLDGLAGNRKDYHWRPNPLVTKWSPPNMKRPMRMPKSWHKFYHVRPYYFNDSVLGLADAHKKGYQRVDINMLLTSEGRAIGMHWDAPVGKGGFWDPLNKTVKGRKVKTMTLDHVKRLKNRRNAPVNTIQEIFAAAGKYKQTLEIDVKLDPRFSDKQYFNRLKFLSEMYGVPFLVKVESTLPGAASWLKAAKAAGCTTAVLPRGTKRLKKSTWWPVADYVRGPVVWVN